jgi:putative ABC transport system permease protein
VGWYIVKVKDPQQSMALARTFDEMFANSQAETKTTTEKGFIEGFAKQIGDIGSIMIAILVAVLFTILLVVGNTMAQAVRERTSELAVLKTLGFSDATVLSLVLAESLFVAIVGGGLGLFVAWLFVQGGDPTGGMLPAFTLPTRDIVMGVVLMVLVGVAAGILPAAGAMRLKITDALRKA